jgi:hypothetical protein
VEEVLQMDHSEYVLWSRYFMRKAQAQELAQKMAGR